MNIRPEDLHLLTTLLLRAGCPLALVLEGGYGPSHGEAIAQIFSAFRHPAAKASPGTPGTATIKLVSLLKKVHRLP
jgi:hypothetical protein